MVAALREAEKEPETRAIIIAGGTNYFSSGQELKEALLAAEGATVVITNLDGPGARKNDFSLGRIP